MNTKQRKNIENLLKDIFYHKENEGIAKTFRNIMIDKWYHESELAKIIGIKNIEAIKSNKIMKDFLGNILLVGDHVLFMSAFTKNFYTSRIKKIGKVKLSLDDYSIREPERVVKIFPSGFEEGTKIKFKK